METFEGITWNSEDLLSSKQALLILLNEGVSYETISDLNFGSLDVSSVIDEYES